MKAQPEDTVHNRGTAAIRMIRRRQIMIRNDHHEFLRCLREGRTDQRLKEVPIEVTLSSDRDLPEVHPVPAGEPNPDCNLVDSNTSEREAPETRDNPLEAVPMLRLPRLTREQLEAMFNESSSEEEEDEVFPTTIPEGWQLPTSAASSRYRPTTPLEDMVSEDEDSRPTSAVSSRYCPTTPLEDMISEDEDSRPNSEERPLLETEDLTLIARKIIETAYLRDQEKEDLSPTVQGLGIRYSDDVVWIHR